ncbi:MAG: hypothetical protein C0490_09280 [Marivirga sp.]|nr:hypothetical protein [Marivirga sp.]
MIRPLRKYHFVIWRFLALVLPLVFIAAIIARPSLPYAVPISRDAFHAELKPLNDSTLMVLIIVNRALTVPSCLVFNVTQTDELLLGKLDHQGTYEFFIKTPEKDVTLKLVDAIHHQVITSIILKQK